MVGARTVLRDDPETSAGYTLLVAVSNPEHVEQLLRTATDVASSNDGEVVVASVIHKPASSPFLLFSPGRIGEVYGADEHQVLERAAAVGSAAGVTVRRHLLVSADVSEGLLTAVREADADALLLGWQEPPRASDLLLGATVERVLARPPCDVYVERVGTVADGVERVLMPTVGGAHAEATTEFVAAVASATGATVTVAGFLDGALDRETARDRVDAASWKLRGRGVDCEGVIRESDDVAASILEAAADHDLVTLGATRRRRLRQRVVGSVAATVARRVEQPVVVVKRGTERSRWIGWFER